MATSTIPHQRLAHQWISRPADAGTPPGDVVRHLGAVQAQDYAGALWGIGARLAGATEGLIEDAIAERAIVRTWPMRGTLHFVPAPDIRWMLELLTPRVIRRSAGRYRDLELDHGVFARSRKVVAKALRGGRLVTRPGLYGLLHAAGIVTDGSRGLHILSHLAQEGLICFGPRLGRQPTFALLPEWVPDARPLPREESLGTLALRYFTSRGPATVADFAWWSGLTILEVRAAVAIAGATLAEETVAGVKYHGAATGAAPPAPRTTTVLLPPFDEYTVAYRDRSAVLDPRHGKRVNSGGGMLSPVLVTDGRVAGTWRRTLARDEVSVAVRPFAPLPAARLRAVRGAADRYRSFLGLERVECVVAAEG